MIRLYLTSAYTIFQSTISIQISTPLPLLLEPIHLKFQSTISIQISTPSTTGVLLIILYFNPRYPYRYRLLLILTLVRYLRFQSTISIQISTNTTEMEYWKIIISIHDIHTDIDDAHRCLLWCLLWFQSTISIQISTDQYVIQWYKDGWFQSTISIQISTSFMTW